MRFENTTPELYVFGNAPEHVWGKQSTRQEDVRQEVRQDCVAKSAHGLSALSHYTGSIAPAYATEYSVQYFTHRQTYGNEKAWFKADGQTSGTIGKAKRLESIRIRLASKPVSGSIQYRTHVQSYGWEKGWRRDGAMSGTKGKTKRLEGIQIVLVPKGGKAPGTAAGAFRQG